MQSFQCLSTFVFYVIFKFLFFSEVTSIASTHPIFNQDPSEFIPEIVKALDDEDPVIVNEALHLLERTVKKDQFNPRFFSAMVRSRDLIQAIVNATNKAYAIMYDTNGVDTNEARCALEAAQKRARISTDILRSMANREGIACEGIVSSCGIYALTLLLPSLLERIKYNCVLTIHTILTSLHERVNGRMNPDKKQLREEAKKQFRDGDGIKNMVDSLKSNNPKLLAVACDCLYYVVLYDKRSKEIILHEKGTEQALEILQKATYPNLIERVLKLLQGK